MSRITETFDVGTGLPGLGSFAVTFTGGTEIELLGPVVAPDLPTQRGGPMENWKRDLFVVTDGPVSDPTRAGVLARALYAGRIDDFGFGDPGEPWTIGGPSWLAWLGDGDGRGSGLGDGDNYPEGFEYTGNLPDFLLAMLVTPRVIAGAGLDATAASVDTGTLNTQVSWWDTARDRINKLCRITDPTTEYYPEHTDLTLYFAGEGDTSNDVFRWDPVVLFAEGITPSIEPGLTSYECRIKYGFSYAPELEEAHVLNGDASFTWSTVEPRIQYDLTGTATGSLGKVLGSGDEVYNQLTNNGTSGTPLLNELQRKYTRADTLTITTPARTLRQVLKPGDFVYVLAERLGLFDVANTVVHGGRSIAPVRYRTSELAWPILPEHGKYIIHNQTAYGGANAVQDVTTKVECPGGDTSLKVATTSPTTLRSIALGTQARGTWAGRP